MKRKAGNKRRILSMSLLVGLMLCLSLVFAPLPIRAETSGAETDTTGTPAGQTDTSAEVSDTTTVSDTSVPDPVKSPAASSTAEESSSEETSSETEPAGPVYHEAVTIPLSSPFTYGSISEDTQLFFITAQKANVYGGAGATFPEVGYTQNLQAFRQLGTETGADGKTWIKILVELENESYEGYVEAGTGESKLLSAQGDAYAAYLGLLGFPESYASRLSAVHAKYPKWFFKPTLNGLDWTVVLDAESNPEYNVGNSLQYVSLGPSSYKSMEYDNFIWASNTWRRYDDGKWTLASDENVAFNLDPRNFLSPDTDSIFLFMNLTFDGTQTVDGVRAIVKGTFMDDAKHRFGETFSYPEELYNIGKTLGVSPYYLASSILQEVGPTGSGSVNGTYSGYPGIYNYYNIQAYAHDGMTPIQAGLRWASQGNTYQRPWNDRQKALRGGAEYFFFNYFERGQINFYYKRFNVLDPTSKFTHQYMTNISGAHSEALKFAAAYNETTRNSILSFDIPVFNNMPAEPCPQPTADGNPNTRLKSISLDGAALTPAFNMEVTSYTAAISKPEIKLSASTIDKKATVTGGGTLTLTEGENLITLTVTAENGDVREYQISIYYADPGNILPESMYRIHDGIIDGIEPGTNTEAFLAGITFEEGVNWSLTDAAGQEKGTGATMKTGDQIRIMAPNGAIWASLTVVIYGDVNGDGRISISDLIMLRDKILGDLSFSDIQALAADVTNDTRTSISDLIDIRDHILGEKVISQTR